MFDSIEIDFQKVQGTNYSKNVILLALSTCGFCRRGITFLNDNNITYRYVYVDKIDKDSKKSMVDKLRQVFDIRPQYPVLIVDDKEYEIGFIESAWKKRLGL